MKFTDRCPSTWKELQDYVALLLNQSGYCATSPCSIDTVRGQVEVDVFVESPDELVKKIVCECKYWNTPVPKEKVHAFRTVVQDSGASMGLLISKDGFQSGAIEAAKFSNVKLITWNEFTNLIANKWIMTNLKRIKQLSIPLSEYMNPMHFPYEELHEKDIPRYKAACDRYFNLRLTCWMLTKSDLCSDDMSPNLSLWYGIKDYSSIESYLNYLSEQVSLALNEFNTILKNSNIEIPPERFEKNEGYTYMFLN